MSHPTPFEVSMPHRQGKNSLQTQGITQQTYVSMPHRQGKNIRIITVYRCWFTQFQCLIGRVKIINEYDGGIVINTFQCLIGRVKIQPTIFFFLKCKEFQCLIGRVKIKLCFIYGFTIITRFQCLIGRVKISFTM